MSKNRVILALISYLTLTCFFIVTSIVLFWVRVAWTPFSDKVSFIIYLVISCSISLIVFKFNHKLL
jgi:hypothetical protein